MTKQPAKPSGAYKPGRAKPQASEAGRDPATSEPAATGISAAAASGAAGMGLEAGGPVPTGGGGAIAGAAAGASKADELAARIDPAHEHDYWREHYRERPYASEGAAYEEVAAAYQHGWEAFLRYGRSATGEPARFEDVEPQVRQDWQAQQRDQALTWEKAQQATRDAWDRVREAMFGDTAKPSAK
jgi:hypothetical protein